jgi:excisionase family DNA binding protein
MKSIDPIFTPPSASMPSVCAGKREPLKSVDTDEASETQASQTATVMEQYSEILKRLDAIERRAAHSDERPLPADEAAEYLGIATSTLYKLSSKNVIPHFKPNGKLIYFSRADLDAFMTRNRVSTSVENERAAAGITSKKVRK